MIDEERRAVAIMVATAGFYMGLAGFPRSGQAQVSAARGTLLASAKEVDGLLFQVAIREIPLDEEFINGTVGREFQIRSNIVTAISPLNREDQIRLTHPDIEHVTKLLIENELPIVPAKENITKIEIKDIQISETPDKEEVFEIILDIILDSFALFDVKEVIKEVIRNHEELNSNLNRLTQSFTGRDWEAVAPLLIEIITIFVGAAFIARIRKALIKKYGRDAAAKIFRRFLTSLSLRLLPFMGAFLYSVGLFLAIKRHAHRFG